jgi:hypothetical protein
MEVSVQVILFFSLHFDIFKRKVILFKYDSVRVNYCIVWLQYSIIVSYWHSIMVREYFYEEYQILTSDSDNF